jgi:DNA-binding protein HU-beta
MAKPMSKGQIVSHLAMKFDLTRKKATSVIEEFATLAVSEIKKSGSFTIPGIGKLVVSKRKPRFGRNPATGQAIKIPAKTVAKMWIGKAAKETIASKR